MPNKHEHDGFPFDLTKDEGVAYLTTAELMLEDIPAVKGWIGAYNRPLIRWDGEWVHLCRTDLADDVATGLCETKSAEEWREYYLGHIRYGVRITPFGMGGYIHHKDGTKEKVEGSKKPRFACIDSSSDG